MKTPLLDVLLMAEILSIFPGVSQIGGDLCAAKWCESDWGVVKCEVLGELSCIGESKKNIEKTNRENFKL